MNFPRLGEQPYGELQASDDRPANLYALQIPISTIASDHKQNGAEKGNAKPSEAKSGEVGLGSFSFRRDFEGSFLLSRECYKEEDWSYQRPLQVLEERLMPYSLRGERISPTPPLPADPPPCGVSLPSSSNWTLGKKKRQYFKSITEPC